MRGIRAIMTEIRGTARTPPPASVDLPAAARQVIRCALEAQLEQRHFDDNDRRAVREACVLARSTGVKAEQLLIVLKDAWRHFAEARRLSRPDAEIALSRIISLCIEEYYSGFGGTPT